MPTTIHMSEIWQAGRLLGRFGGTLLAPNIRVEMYGAKMVIKENNVEVFSMKKLAVVDAPEGLTLLIDYPKTAEGQDGRGWGILGMLIALYHGQSKGCALLELGTEIEMTHGSLSLWGKFGIGKRNNIPLLFSLNKGPEWVLTHCHQEDRKITDFVLR